jgi:glycosyltransferase involved in cell wall biosynthesis
LGEQYKQVSLAARLLLDRFSPRLRQFDFESAQRVDHFVANSHFVADRIRRYYGRESDVVYPPVAVDDFRADRRREPFALVVSELVPYKRIDIAVEAFTRLRRRLVVIGDGSQRKSLQKMAGSTVSFLGRQPFSILKEHFETAAAFIFPGIEDFGITPVEAQAAGCPVIAFAAGGALETVVDGETGLLFGEQTSQSLIETLQQSDVTSLDANVCRENAERFSTSIFHNNLSNLLGRLTASAGGADRSEVTSGIDAGCIEACCRTG